MRRMLSPIIDGGIQLLGSQSAIKVDPCLKIRRAGHITVRVRVGSQPVQLVMVPLLPPVCPSGRPHHLRRSPASANGLRSRCF
jgi:hypothetical protein